VSSFSTDFEIPKFIAIITTNTRYHFRGRRTFYPGITNFSTPSQANNLLPVTGKSPQEEESKESTIQTLPEPETEMQALRRKLATLMSGLALSPVTCAGVV